MNVRAKLSDHQLAGAIARHLFVRDVAVAALDPRVDHGGLRDEERPAVLRAVKARRLEFTAGRTAARKAMAELGTLAVAIPSNTNRVPVWPTGLVGSISHCETACLAAIAHSRDVASIGIDIEPAGPLDPDFLGIVCTEAERDWLAGQDPADAGLLAKLVFSAKECAYKCQYPLTQQVFGFRTLTLAIDLETATFAAEFTRKVGVFPNKFCLNGRFAISAGLIVTAALLRPAELGNIKGCVAS